MYIISPPFITFFVTVSFLLFFFLSILVTISLPPSLSLNLPLFLSVALSTTLSPLQFYLLFAVSIYITFSLLSPVSISLSRPHFIFLLCVSFTLSLSLTLFLSHLCLSSFPALSRSVYLHNFNLWHNLFRNWELHLFCGKYVRYVRAELVRVGIPTSSWNWSCCSSWGCHRVRVRVAARVLSHLRKSGNKLAKISERTAAIFMRLRAATCCTVSLSAVVCGLSNISLMIRRW